MIDRVAYQQAKRERQLAAMRAAFRLKEAAEVEEKAARHIRMEALAEQAETRRAVERAERRRKEAEWLRDPANPLYAVVQANTIGEREFSEKEIAALQPCGRFEQFKHKAGQKFLLDAKHAVMLGATLPDLEWVARALVRFNSDADRRYTLWQEECKHRGQTHKLQRFIEIFSVNE